MPLEITNQLQDQVTVLALNGDLDTNTSGRLEALVKEITAQYRPALVLDMAELRFVSSFGLRVVIMASKAMRSHGDRFALCNVQAEVLAILRIAGFVSFLKITDTRDAAIASIRP